MRLTLALLALVLVAAKSPAGENPATVVVIYRTNCDDYDKDGTGDSEQIARYYAARRGIPSDHLLGVKVELPGGANPFDKYLRWTWESYRSALVKPLRAKLNALGRTRIQYIVTTFGLPLRVQVPTGKTDMSADVALAQPFRISEDGLHSGRYYDLQPDGRYGAQHFEAFRARHAASDPPDDIGYIVSRIDGVSVAACKSLIDGAIYADTYKLDGFAYVDNRYGVHSDAELRAWQSGGHYFALADIDKGVESTRSYFQAAKLKVRQQPDDESIGDSKAGLRYTDGSPADVAPRALAYAGWYNYGRYNAVWDWLPGSVAIDFDSASLYAHNLFMGSFDGMALFNGASGAVGCFAEPYANGHPQPDVFFAYYTRGYTFGESAWLSMPQHPFVDFAIGDPLMNPYGRGRSRDNAISLPSVTVSTGHDGLHVSIVMTGKAEIARARMVVADARNDKLLAPPTYHDGRYQREFGLTAPRPRSDHAWIGVVVTDPAGNTARVWTEWKA
ncbi:MAG TPA: TIGR03790 family protein [Armatimonadota bacterium]|jgi:uncharacterized protein (TIGR03790 family)